MLPPSFSKIITMTSNNILWVFLFFELFIKWDSIMCILCLAIF